MMRTETLNHISKLISCEPCPNGNCGFLIQKNGGCNHMKCESCKHEFCWLCLGHYYGYKHSDADNGAVCGQRAIAGLVMLGFCGFAIYMKLLLSIGQFSGSLINWDLKETAPIGFLGLVFSALSYFLLALFWICYIVCMVATAGGLTYLLLDIKKRWNESRYNAIKIILTLGYALLLSKFSFGRYGILFSLGFYVSHSMGSQHLTRRLRDFMNGR